MVTVAIHNQNKKDKGLLVMKEFLSLSELHVSLQVLYKIPSGLWTLCVCSPRQSLAVLAPRKVFNKLSLCGVTQLQNGL